MDCEFSRTSSHHKLDAISSFIKFAQFYNAIVRGNNQIYRIITNFGIQNLGLFRMGLEEAKWMNEGRERKIIYVLLTRI